MTHPFDKNLTKKTIFRNLTDSRSSGMENAQNFAAVISSMVLRPSCFVYFVNVSPKICKKSDFPKFEGFYVFQYGKCSEFRRGHF